MTLFSKIKWILGVVMIFVLVLTTNLIDRQNFAIVSDSIETIYADRLVAQDIIYNMSTAVNQKQLAYLQQGDNNVRKQETINVRLQNDIARFAVTKLTPAEAGTFNQLKKELVRLKGYEADQEEGATLSDDIETSIIRVKEYLDDLSAVQMAEGNRELHESKRAINSANLFTQLEIAALVIMAILIQIIILYTPKLDPDA